MRVCAGLTLSAVLCSAASATPAGADTYCAHPSPKTATDGACAGQLITLQGALELASAHPGPDTVGVTSGFYRLTSNLSYSDRGQSDNGVTIEGMPTCGRYGCQSPHVSGTATSGSLLSFGGGGGAEVTVSGFHLSTDEGTALTPHSSTSTSRPRTRSCSACSARFAANDPEGAAGRGCRARSRRTLSHSSRGRSSQGGWPARPSSPVTTGWWQSRPPRGAVPSAFHSRCSASAPNIVPGR